MKDPVAQMGPAQQDGAHATTPPPPVDVPVHNVESNRLELEELIQRRRLSPQQWQHIVAAYTVLCDSTVGRMVTARYEVFRDDDGCVHVVISPAAG
jgi:hypothetical protein